MNRRTQGASCVVCQGPAYFSDHMPGASTMNMTKPHCFACGADAEYELSVQLRPLHPAAVGDFPDGDATYLLCGSCIKQMRDSDATINEQLQSRKETKCKRTN